jgi:hypothetical protein
MARHFVGKRTREQAALVCAIAACERKRSGLSMTDIALHLNVSHAAYQLAMKARAYVADMDGHDGYEHACAEAEALLRCGWSPS